MECLVYADVCIFFSTFSMVLSTYPKYEEKRRKKIHKDENERKINKRKTVFLSMLRYISLTGTYVMFLIV